MSESRMSYKGGADKDIFSHIGRNFFYTYFFDGGIPACRQAGQYSLSAFGLSLLL